MTCPFCSGALATVREDDLGEGETGGRACTREHRCVTCRVVLVQSRVDKIGKADESWRIASVPIAEDVMVPEVSSAPPCARCGGVAIVAMPARYVPAPARAWAESPAQLRLTAQTRCCACGTIGQVSTLAERDNFASG